MPTLIRLLKPGEIAPGPRGGARRRSCKEGRYVTDGFGLYPTIVNPPYTTLTAYDLNRARSSGRSASATICVSSARAITGTGTAATVKGGIITTATGLVFVTAADRKVHVYDSATGKQIWELPLGGATTGAPSMYELGGRQYLLVTASGFTGRGATAPCRSHRDHRLRPRRETDEIVIFSSAAVSGWY